MKEKKKRISRESPSFYLPLPYAMAVRKQISDDEMDNFLFQGMQLSFQRIGVVNNSIGVIAHYNDADHVIGYVPNGMMSRIEGLIEHEQKVSVTLERLHCDRLSSAFWICIDELPELQDLGLKLGLE